MQHRLGVLHLISSKAFLGAERVVCELVKQSDTMQFSVKVGLIVSNTELTEAFQSALGSADHCLETFHCPSRFDLNLLLKLRNCIIDNNISIIHSHGYKSNFYAYLAKLIAPQKIKIISSNHLWKLNTIQEKIYKQIDVLVLQGFNKIIAISQDIHNQMITVGIPETKITLIDNGINVDICTKKGDREKARQKLGLDNSEFVIGCVASLTPEKSQQDLIVACDTIRNIVPKLKLVLVGEGDQRDTLKRLSSELGMEEQVLFTGKRNDVHSLYPAFDLFALVSSVEGLPMALLEAMASGIPVVVSSVGAIPDVIEHGVNGLMIKPANINEISSAILHLANNGALRNKIGAAGRETIVSKYSSERMAHDYEKIYLELANNL